MGHAGGISSASWPAFDAEAAKAEEIVIPVQVNGKVRARLTVPAETTDEELEKLALADAAVQPVRQGKTVKKIVIAKGRLGLGRHMSFFEELPLCIPLCPLWWSAWEQRLRLRAGRPRVHASAHDQDHRDPALYESDDRLQSRDDVDG